jgi:hypothetical protein
MKKLIFSLLIVLIGFSAKTQLVAGDIAFIGYNEDLPVDGFSIITLNSIPGGQQIYFTDKGIATATTWTANSEDHWLFTAPAAGISCGTVISFTENVTDVITITGISGATMVHQSGTGLFNLSGGDQMLAYTVAVPGVPLSPSSATFISGITLDDGNGTPTCLDLATGWSSDGGCIGSSVNRCLLPPGLTNAVNCVSLFPTIGTELDNSKYNGTLTGTSTALRAAINDRSNWVGNDATNYDISPSGYPAPSVTCVAPCSNPTVPTVTFAPATVCAGSTATLTITGTLNDATAWHIYSGSCGGTFVGSTAGTTFVVTPGSPSTTYFVRGQGGCVSPGACGNVTINTTALDNSTFTYGAAAYCKNGVDPTPTIPGPAGTFTSSPAGLSINATTGTIDVSASTAGTYTITRTTSGTCPTSSTGTVTINNADNASFTYGAAAYCKNGINPTPTIPGPAGTFTSSPAGLSINATTGTINLLASTAGTYTITRTTSGTCPNTATGTVTINNTDNAGFTYGAAAYCKNGTNPTPTISGLPGGTFTSSPAGLSINASTGTITVATSTAGTYTVTYTTTGTCPNSATFSVTINNADNATFTYGAAAYCKNGTNPTPTIPGPAGTFTSSPAGLSINATTGTINLLASTAGTYTITRTTSGTCPNTATGTVTINNADNAGFTYGAAAYCKDGADPTPTISGLPGGTFTSAPAGLSINASTGTIDVSASTAATYTVTYTTTGTCPNTATFSVTINNVDNSSFTYGAAAYCTNGTDPTPTIPGPAGTFTSSPAGLSINATTGTIDVSASTAGSYTITRTTSGTCPSSTTGTITINNADNAGFSYGAAAYCKNGTNPTPTISGLPGGTFTSSPAGLSINTSTGTITVATSTAGTYTVTYTTTGTCPNSATFSVTINNADNSSFTYGAAAYCKNGIDPTPTIPGPAGTFTSSPAGLSINATTGTIDVSASTAGTYTITRTTSGTCPSSSTGTVTINNADNAGFSYGAAAYCKNGTNPTPTISGLPGGTFTSSPAGLSINASTGTITVATSTAGTYTVTYTTTGTCPNSATFSVTINNADNAGFTYGAPAYCKTGADPTPTISGLPGGTFTSAPAGLSINAATGTIDVSASTAATYTVTYTTTGTCPNSATFSVTINNADNAGFSYGAAAYCKNGIDPTPTISGLPGGTFTSSPAGLSINASTGTIDVSASTAATYTVTYTTAGTCPNSATFSVTINNADNAGFSYGAAAYCKNGTNPTPTISGLPGGTFTSSPAGLSINASTGTITVGTSTAGTYTVTYTTAGTCPNSATFSVTINNADNAGFSYGAAAYCKNGTNPTPTISGLPGGTFTSSPAGLSINASTGTITVATSTAGTYTVTYTTAGTCPNSATFSVIINNADNASFAYGAGSYCVSALDPTPTISGLPGGTFTSSPAGLSINASTGTIDVSASTPNTYTVTYTTSGSCPNSATTTIVINTLDNANFNYAAALYCPNGIDPTPTISGVPGGTFTSSPAGLSINATTGTIDLSASIENTYTVTYTTGGACSNSANRTVTVNDATAPVPVLAVLPVITAQCSVASLPNPGVTDNCGGTVTITNDAIFPIVFQGTTVVTWTYNDGNGNISTQTQNVVIDDITAPVPTLATLPAVTAECSVASLVSPTATDNCGGTITVTNDAIFPIVFQGTTVVTWTYNDGRGNTTTQTQNVIIDDVTDPVPVLGVLPTITAECTVVALTPPTATDNCGGTITVTRDVALPISTQGTTVVTWTYDDGRGNTTTQTQNVVIDDVTLPVIASCPSDITINSNTTGCAAIVSWTPPTVTDNCVGVTMTSSHAPGSVFPLGTTTVTYTAIDAGLNTVTCTFTVTVVSPLTVSGIVTDVILGTDGAIDLTATGGAGFTYDWDIDGTGDFDDAADLTGLSIGTYTVVVRNSIGCEVTETFEVVLDCHLLDVTVSDFEVCQNEFLILDATSESGAVITWDGGATDGIGFNPLTTGTITYTATSADSEDCPYSVSIVVLPIPEVVASIGDGEICVGEDVVLASSGDADVYTWDPLDLTPDVGTTVYTLTGTDLGTGCSNTDEVELIVHALPIVTATANYEVICEGVELILTGSGASTYIWSPDGILNAVPFLPGEIGTYFYTVTGEDLNGCVGTTEIEITVVAPISITFDVTSDTGGGNGAIDATVTGGVAPYSFDWDNDGTGDFDDTEDLADLTNGVYLLNVESDGGCSASVNVIVDLLAGINEVIENVIAIYPNPTTEFVTIQVKGAFNYQVYNTEGQLLFSGNGLNTKEISLEGFASGMYFCVIEANEQLHQVKVVKN